MGIVFTPTSTRQLVQLVGPATARYLLYSGELVDAGTALRTGLVDRLLPAGDLAGEVRRFAEVLATRSALTQRAAKQVTAALAAGRPESDVEELADRWYRETAAAGELAEGVAAFTERRPPDFPWRG